MRNLRKLIVLPLVVIILTTFIGCTVPDNIKTSIQKTFSMICDCITGIDEFKPAFDQNSEKGKDMLAKLEILQTALKTVRSSIIGLAMFCNVNIDYAAQMDSIKDINKKSIFDQIQQESHELNNINNVINKIYNDK